MTTENIARLEQLLDGPRDGALLRYSLGSEWLKAGEAQRAVGYLRAAVERQPDYSAAWKALGKALSAAGENSAALAAFERGVAVAKARGDIQAAKEMAVFARRLLRQAPTTDGNDAG